MDFSDLVTREIDERFCYIKYDTLELIMMKENNYVNATKLCKLGGKDFHLWKHLDGSKELIEEIKRINNVWKIKSAPQDLGVPEVIITVEPEDKSDKKYEVAGSYIHQDLLYHITSWISPSFSVKVSKIVNCYIYGKYEFKVKEKENKIDELMELLYKFNDKYDKDTAKLDKYNKLMEEKYDRDIAETRELYRGQHEEVKVLKKHNKKLSNSIKRIERKYSKNANELKSKLLEVKTELKKLEEILQDKVVNISLPNKVHRMVISQNNEDSNILKLYDYKPKV